MDRLGKTGKGDGEEKRVRFKWLEMEPGSRPPLLGEGFCTRGERETGVLEISLCEEERQGENVSPQIVFGN